MIPVLDNTGMREADRHTIEDLGVPGMVLMENAATGVVDAVRERYPKSRKILILCGPGNNGGDGLAAARHFLNGGREVKILLFGDPEKLSADAAANYAIAKSFRVPIVVVPGDDLAVVQSELEETPPDVVIDALLGTGIDRPLGGRLQAAATLVSQTGAPVVAVDVPTGLNGSRSDLPGPVLSADLTVTFAALKVCHTLPPACAHCGEIAVADIGVPPAALEENCHLRWIEDEDIELLLPNRRSDGHKGSFGHLLLVAGAEGRGGAVAMAARAAVVTGSGLVTMAVPRPAVEVVDSACLEAMSHPMVSTDAGEMAGPEGLEPILQRMTAIAIGPGMGTNEGAAHTLEWVLDHWQGPLLLDADALNLLAGSLERLQGRNQFPVLTPHPGELSRLLGRETDEIVADRVAAAREAASRAQAVVIAKGHRTVIAEPEGEVWINPTGDSGLASGGSGDVLTGAVGAFLAQGLDPIRAAQAGCWLHGRAGEIGGERYPAAVPAAELPSLLAQAWLELETR